MEWFGVLFVLGMFAGWGYLIKLELDGKIKRRRW